MKRKISVIILTIICFLFCALALTACSENNGNLPTHTHSYQWIDNGDGTHKQHCSVEGCNMPDKNIENHIWGVDNKCEKCEAVKPIENLPEHSHIWAKIWKNNDMYHWHDCTVADCPITDNAQKDGYGEHDALGVNGSCSICGYIPLIIEATSITLNQTSLTLDIGANATLTATIFPSNAMDKSVTWKSDKPNIASVDATGNITAVSKGTAIITVSTKNGKTAMCTVTINKASITNVVGAEIDGTQINMLVDHTTNSVSLGNKVIVSSGKWFLCSDILGQNQIPTKIAAGADGKLKDGENNFYIILQDSKGDFVDTYTLTIYRSFAISINYHGVYNEIIKSESVYSGYEYTITYTLGIEGYTFNGWKLNGKQTAKIIPFADTDLYADCTANDYILTFDADGGTVSENFKAVTYDRPYVLPIPKKTGHTFLGWYDGETKITNDDGNSLQDSKFTHATVLTAKWQINKYTFRIYRNMSNSGTITSNVSNGWEYNYNTKITLATTQNLGYTFLGWYNGDDLLESNLEYTFDLPDSDTSITAKYQVNVEMRNFNFTSTLETCTISDVINKTITKITIPNYVTSIGNSAFDGCNELVSITVSDKNSVYASQDGILYNKSKTSFVAIPSQLSGNITISNGITSIASYAFSGRTEITGIIIPNSITIIGSSAFNGCTGLMSIVIPASVTSIGSSAFNGCTGLTELNYNATACADFGFNNQVFNNAGQNDNGITVTIGTSVTSIPAHIFHSVTKVVNIAFEKGSECKNIGSYAFYNCSRITNVTIPDSVTNIGSYAFYNCSGLTSITIPDSVTSVGTYAFSGCTGLTEINYNAMSCADFDSYGVFGGAGQNSDGVTVNIGSNVTRIPAYLFSGSVNKIVNVVFEKNSKCEGIGSNAFSSCIGLRGVYIADIADWSEIEFSNGDSNPLYHAKKLYLKGMLLTELTIPDGVTSIGNYAFYGCESLTNVKMPDTTTNIGNAAFFKCSNLTDVTIPSNIVNIGDNAFASCQKLTRIYYNATECQDLNNNSNVFSSSGNNESGITVHIGDNVERIPAYLFSTGAFTSHIVEVLFSENSNCASIGPSSFSGDPITNIIIPKSVISIDKTAFSTCYNLESIVVASGNITYHSDNNCIIETATKTLVLGCKNSVIPNDGSVLNIGDYAFKNCLNLVNIVISNSIINIGSYAFSGCSELTSITIPNSVISIGSYAFEACFKLNIHCEEESQPSGWNSDWNSDSRPVIWNYKNNEKDENGYVYVVIDGIQYSLKDNIATVIKQLRNNTTVNIPSVVSHKGIEYNVTSIGSSAFSGCYELTTITIPDGVTNIGELAFNHCTGLTNITIPNSITSIGMQAFYNCSVLTKIIIPNNVTYIGSYAFTFCESLTIYCETDCKQNNWRNDWNSNNCPVIWDCKNNEKDENGYIYTVIDGIRYSLKDNIATVVKQPLNITSANIPTIVIYKGNEYSVTNIGEKAFNFCSELTSITIPNSITNIGSSAFSGCTGLTSITIPNSITNIGSSAFSGCTGLISITISNSITSISSYAFSGCTGLTSITIPNSITSIGSSVFSGCTGLTSIIIPDDVTSIGELTFFGCSNLTIYCEAINRPSGWNTNWNYSYCPVVWGYQG